MNYKKTANENIFRINDETGRLCSIPPLTASRREIKLIFYTTKNTTIYFKSWKEACLWTAGFLAGFYEGTTENHV
jgi:hypothetical protein